MVEFYSSQLYAFPHTMHLCSSNGLQLVYIIFTTFVHLRNNI